MKFFTILVVPFFLLVPIFVSAQESTALPSATETTAQLVADVNLQDCSYTQASSADQLMTMKCSITNNLGNQGDIRYGVQLIKKVGDTQEVVDTKIYSEVLSLGEKQTIQKSIEYTPAAYLSGKYELWGILKTTNGLPLSSNLFGTVTLKASSSSYLEIKSGTCSLKVTNEEGAKTNTIDQRPSIGLADSVEGSCSVVSHSTGDITVTPSFATYRGSIFGETVSDTKNVQQSSVVFKNNETKTVSFVLPKASVPQSYDAILSLVSSDASVVSNEIIIPYLLNGASATIQNVVLDKDYYSRGDTAIVSVFWTGVSAANLTISIKDSDNNLCAKETAFPVATGEIGSNGLKNYPVSITRGCANPNVILKIVNASGSVLAEKAIVITSEQVPENTLQSFLEQKTTLYGVVALSFIVIAVAGIMLMKNRKKHYENY